jgi:hypothetical protein
MFLVLTIALHRFGVTFVLFAHSNVTGYIRDIMCFEEILNCCNVIIVFTCISQRYVFNNYSLNVSKFAGNFYALTDLNQKTVENVLSHSLKSYTLPTPGSVLVQKDP